MQMTLTKKDSPYTHWEYLDADTEDRLRIVPERGGLITEWRCNGQEILYFDSERFQQKGKSVRGGIPILFPICGNLPDDILHLEKGDFILRQHGFARDICWQVQSVNDQNAVLLSLSDNEYTRRIYPYSFLLEMEIRLQKDAIKFKIIVRNSSKDIMPFSFGLHPYFNVMDLKKAIIKGLQPTSTNHLNMMEVDTDEELKRISEGIDLINGPSESVTLVDLLAGTCLQVQQQEPMDLTVVWTDPPRKMVCLEPWTSPRESLISGERRLYLEPGANQELNCSFRVFH